MENDAPSMYGVGPIPEGLVEELTHKMIGEILAKRVISYYKAILVESEGDLNAASFFTRQFQEMAYNRLLWEMDQQKAGADAPGNTEGSDLA